MAIIYRFPAGYPHAKDLRDRANEEGVAWDPQRVITIGGVWRGYSGIDASDMSQSELDRIMTVLEDMTGQNVDGPYTRQEVLSMQYPDSQS